MIALKDFKHGDRLDVPRNACQFVAEDFKLMAPADGQRSHRFEMVATTGKVMKHWYWGNLAVDLDGIQRKQKLPVLKDHDPDQRVGFTERIALEDGKGLVASGRMLQSDAAAEIRADAADGFPWQASVYLQTQRIQLVDSDQEVEVNGYRFKGPGAVLRETVLREVTFTALGADDDTSATPLSRNVAGETVTATVERESNTMSESKDSKQPPSPEPAKTPPVAATKLGWGPGDDTIKRERDEARDAERDRARSIMRASADQQRELADQLIDQGVPLTEALVKLNEDLRDRLAIALRVPRPTIAAPLARGNTARNTTKAEEVEAEAEAVSTEPEGPMKWKKEFAASASLQKEYGEEKFYLAFKKNEHLCTDFAMAPLPTKRKEN